MKNLSKTDPIQKEKFQEKKERLWENVQDILKFGYYTGMIVMCFLTLALYIFSLVDELFGTSFLDYIRDFIFKII